jgi:DNA-binding NtrC family response regulator
MAKVAVRIEKKKRRNKMSIKNHNLRVLVVDDEANVLESVNKILERKGFEVAKTQNPEDALRQFKGEGFDLVIADLMMPKVSGLELLKAVKNENPGVPFLMITGYPSINTAVEATKNGASGFLPKPFTPVELEEAVEKALGGTKEYEAADALPAEGQIDVDMPFDAREVARATSENYVENLTRSDIAVAHAHKEAKALDFCAKGERSCKKYVKSGECAEICPFVAKAQKEAAKSKVQRSFVDDPIDVDMPFSFSEVAAATSEAYAMSLGNSDMPVVGHYQRALKSMTSPKVLVVDDEAVVVNSVRKTLEKRGFSVEGAFNGKEAVAKASQGGYNLVILDMKLGNENGLDLISKLKNASPETSIVVVTGFASIDTAIESVRRGANDYMAKPFTPEELYNVTEKNIREKVA